MEEKNNHGSIVLENREKLFLYGVSDSESFDENAAVLITNLGRLVIEGKNLHLAKLSLIPEKLLSRDLSVLFVMLRKEPEKKKIC